MNVSGRSLFLGSFTLVLLGLVAGLWLSRGTACAATLVAPSDEKTAPAPTPESRTLAPRPDLGEGEQRTIRLFEEASPSVVYITTVAEQIDLFSARPIASICRSPPDSVAAICSRRSIRRGKMSNT